jgi:hypothetical protein
MFTASQHHWFAASPVHSVTASFVENPPRMIQAKTNNLNVILYISITSWVFGDQVYIKIYFLFKKTLTFYGKINEGNGL